MSNLIPDRYITLRDALDRVGRYEFPSEWTGDELDAEPSFRQLLGRPLSDKEAKQARLWERREAAERALWQVLQGAGIDAAYVRAWDGELVALKARWWRSEEGRTALRDRRYGDARRDQRILVPREDVRKSFGSPPRTAAKPQHDDLVQFLINILTADKIPEPDCRAAASERFGVPISDDDYWREAWSNVPPKLKRRRGEKRDR